MTKSILLVGVGGQGTILASNLLTLGLMEAGYDVKMSEIHGMSQRGGSVSSHVRYGDEVASSVIEIGGADIIVAFEKMEALRWLKYLKPEGKVVVNDYEIDSMPILTGKFDYPDNITEDIKELADTKVLSALKVAEELGNKKVMNIVLLGALVEYLNIDNIDWHKVIEQNVKEKFVEINKKALDMGIQLMS